MAKIKQYQVDYVMPFSNELLKFELTAETSHEAIEACVEELHSLLGYNIDVRSLISQVIEL
jgi:hypothetical protein